MHTAIIVAEALSILYLLILLFSMLRTGEKHRTSVAFTVCLGVAVIGVGTDLLSYALEYTTSNHFWLTVINMFSFFGYDFELMAFAVYICMIISEKEKAPLSFIRFIGILCLVDILFTSIGSVTGKLFLIEDGNFIAGPWYDLLGVIGFIVLGSLFVFAIKKRKAVGNKPVIFVVIFFIVTYTLIFVSLITELESYIYVGMSFVMMLVYLILQRGEIENGQMRERIMFEISTTDVLTKLNNRLAYENALVEASAVSSIGVIFCDVNGLKTANDTLGHAAGDALLQHFSDILKKYFSSSDIFRISGDEFVVLLQNVKEDDFAADVGSLKKVIADEKDIASVGYASGSGSDVLELISVAEKDMYSDKEAYYKHYGLDRRRT